MSEPLMFSGSWRVMEPDEKLEITLQDGTVLHGRVIDASPPSDDGSVTYIVSWEAGETGEWGCSPYGEAGE